MGRAKAEMPRPLIAPKRSIGRARQTFHKHLLSFANFGSGSRACTAAKAPLIAVQ